MKLLVSACLLGENCKYSGGNNYSSTVAAFCQGHQVFSVCPEVMGGLPTPRVPSERVGERVIAQDGTDVTGAFYRGARQTLQIAQEKGIDLAILQSRSPSCGVCEIYDGTFSGGKIAGQGVCAQLLAQAGFTLMDAQDVPSA